MKKFILFTMFVLSGCYNPKAIVFHSTAYDAKRAIETYREYDVSVHYIIEADGSIISDVHHDKYASHAGKSYWRGYDRMNPNAIGIEVLEPSLGQKPYTKAQIKAITKLSKELIKEYGINQKMIVGHSDISADRKADPGKCFPWQELSEQGVGLWYYLPDYKKVKTNDAKEMLAQIGYDVSDFSAAQYAFARRYVPQMVKTEPDMKNLLENPYPKNFDAIKNKKFMNILKAVYYRYSLPQCFN